MKIRMDFVTNSSSSSYIILQLDENYYDDVLRQNGIDPVQLEHDICNGDYDRYEDYKLLKDGKLALATGEYGIAYVGHDLSERELDQKTLMQIKQEVADKVKEAYGICVSTRSFELNYGEYER